MNIDLTQYVVAKWGAWFLDKEAFSPNELRLGTVLDGVTLAGPLCIRVAVQARNQFTLFGTSAVALQARDVFSYKLDIPPGQTWTYPGPRALRPETGTAPTPPLVDAAGARLEGIATRPGIIVDPVFGQDYGRDVLWGANAGFGVAIRACGPDLCADPCAPDPCRPVDPCAPKEKCKCGGGCGGGCGCGCHEGHGDDLPCDFATGGGSHLGMFFPAACEPCVPGAFVGMPPVKGPSLIVPAARGGTVRTRYFNGMFITKEDLWTDQNNNRIKHALMNRAMGQGVVWGFDLCLDGDVVCVLPGYGVDCCGNDVVVSCAYRVDSQALLRDPAAAAMLGKGRSQRMNLLLEYYECPEEPRPVHGDPCAPDSVRCEMSRIRETARLRLVPPCDVDDSGCIKDFLDEVRKLKGDRIVGPILTTGLATSAPAMPMPVTPALTTSPATSVPFEIVVKGLTQVAIDPANSATYTIKYNPFDSGNNVSIAVQPAGGAAFTGGRIRETQPTMLPIAPSVPPNGFTWSFHMGLAEESSGKIVDLVESWTMTQGADQYGGEATLKLSGVRRQDAQTQNLTIDVKATATVTRADQPPPPPPPSRFPCWSEACDPEGRPRFPVAIPWLHEDPGHPGQAGDPKVIVLAILYALFVSKIAQSGPATTAEVKAEQEGLARALNLSAWKLFYDDVSNAERLDLMDAFRRLFQCWCKALLYPGPRCECGCDPHGVIVGCALVEGGTLRMVDPWGGRRWVVHYPLLAYWGKQFGIQPLDALASKFFDLICCVAHLYPAKGTTGLTTALEQPIAGLAAPAAAVVPFGDSALIFDQPANVPAHLARMGVVPERTLEVGPAEFIAHVVEAMNAPAGAPAPGTSVVHYTVRSLPQLHFIAPAGGALPAAPSGPAVAVAPRPAGSRLADLVRSAIANRPARAAVPPLLRAFSEELTKRLLQTIPLEATSEAARAVRDALGAAGIHTLAELLDSHPEELHADVLSRTNAAGLADLLESGERTTASVAKAVGDVVQRFSAEGRLLSRDELRSPELGAEFRKSLAEALRGAVPPEKVAAEVDATAGPVG